MLLHFSAVVWKLLAMWGYQKEWDGFTDPSDHHYLFVVGFMWLLSPMSAGIGKSEQSFEWIVQEGTGHQRTLCSNKARGIFRNTRHGLNRYVETRTVLYPGFTHSLMLLHAKLPIRMRAWLPILFPLLVWLAVGNEGVWWKTSAAEQRTQKGKIIVGLEKKQPKRWWGCCRISNLWVKNKSWEEKQSIKEGRSVLLHCFSHLPVVGRFPEIWGTLPIFKKSNMQVS